MDWISLKIIFDEFSILTRLGALDRRQGPVLIKTAAARRLTGQDSSPTLGSRGREGAGGKNVGRRPDFHSVIPNTFF